MCLWFTHIQDNPLKRIKNLVPSSPKKKLRQKKVVAGKQKVEYCDEALLILKEQILKLTVTLIGFPLSTNEVDLVILWKSEQ